MTLSICMPTYNRGERAFQNTINLLNIADQYENDVQIIVSNNGSTKGTEYYKKIKQLHHPRLKFHEFDSNHLYWGNIIQVLKMSDSDFSMIISDEDSIIAENLGYYLDFLKELPDLGLMKASGNQYNYQENAYYSRGLEAVKRYAFTGNYVSGVIYNRGIITDDLIHLYVDKYSVNNIAFYYYPHMFFEHYSLLQGGFACCDYQLIIEGEPLGLEPDQRNSVLSSVEREVDIPAYATFSERLAQMNGFNEQIHDFKTSEAVTFNLFYMNIRKHLFLSTLMRQQYIAGGYDWSAIIEEIRKAMIDMIHTSPLPVIINARQDLIDYVNLSLDQWACQEE